MRRNKLLSIMVTMIAIGIFMLIFGDLLGKKENKKKVGSETDVSTEASTEEDHIKDPEAYAYADIQLDVAYLASTNEQKTALNRLFDPLNASDSVNVTYIKKMVDIIGVDTEVYTGVLRGRADNDVVKKKEFDEIYGYIVDSGNIEGIKRENIYVFGWTVSEESKDGYVDTIYDGNNYYKYDVDITTEYSDSIIDVYTKDGTIFKLNGYGDAEVTLENVWLSGIKDGKGEFLYKGVTKECSAISSVTDTSKDGFVADIVVSNMGICSYKKKTDVSEITVEAVKDDKLISSDGDEIELDDKLYIYDVSGTPYCENSVGILKGYKSVELVKDKNRIAAVVVRNELISDKIRVLLSNDDYSSYDLNTVSISCNTAFNIEYPDGHIEENALGTTITVDHKAYEEGEKLIFTPVSTVGRLKVLSINRSYGNPEYRGSLEVTIMEDSVRIINELPLEEYLYSVVSSEMNSNSPLEALKAIAICARGYAYSRIMDESYAAYDAHIDDSSLCQMYNNVIESEATIYAVKETYGVVPKHEDVVITPLYFSTSAGITCTNSDIWGGNDYPYLTANVEDMNKSQVDLSKEEDFKKFIDNSLGYSTIEKDMPYYRWDVEFSQKDISDAVNSMLQERIKMSPENIKVKQVRDTDEDENKSEDEDADEEDDEFISENIKDIGTIKSIKVTERSSSGVVMTLEIEGTKVVIQVTGQTNIRNLITPVNQEIKKQDGSVVTGWTSLPSPFYYVEGDENGFIIHGGGFGHGAGMSQNGACILAEQGYDCEYILKHYYSNIELDTIDSLKKALEEKNKESEEAE